MAIQFNCPTGGINVRVNAQGSGAPGTICVCGSCQETVPGPTTFLQCLLAAIMSLVRWLFGRPATKRARLTLAPGAFVRVRILNGSVTTLPSPTPSQAGDVDVAAGPHWCACPVPVPSWSSAGVPLTAVAWLLSNNGSGGVTVNDSQSVLFNGGGPNPTDCCAVCGCGSGSGSASGLLMLAAELGGRSDLVVSVPDGPNAGHHQARAVAPLRWELVIRGAAYTISCCGPGAGLIMRGPSSSVSALATESVPFSAVFSGAVLRATGDVVIIKS